MTKQCMAAITALLIGVAGPAMAEDYRLGYITDLSGPLAGSYTPVWEGFDLYMKSRNAAGGINGNQVETFLDDDGLRADRSVAAAKKQIERDNVIGIFGLSLSSTHGPTFAETRQAGIPVVTSFSGIIDALPPAKPYSYSTGVMFEVAGEAIATLSKQIAPSGKVVGVTFDSVGGRAALRHNQLMAQKLGYQWGEVIFPVRTADFTPFAQAIVNEKPDIVVGHYGAEQNLGVIAALRATGYTGPYVIASYGASEATVQQAAEQSGDAENLYMVSRYAPATHEGAGIAALRQAAEAAGVTPTSMHVTGWALGMVAEEALKKCGASCDKAGLDKALQQVNIDTQGLTGGPIEMSADDHYGPTYWKLYKWDGEKLVGTGDWHKQTTVEFLGQ
ncbi:MAG: ABC transporter substrate-binding protein [Rhizobiaceae bacterium]|nr:ABC transporter substrate-binding protein [Rhizobiaceae bacterium]